MAQDISPSKPIEPRRDVFEWGTMEWKVDDSLAPGTGMSVAVMFLQAGKATPTHHHPNCSELLYVLEGKVEVLLDGKKTVLLAGDSALSPMGCVHGVKNTGKADAKLLLSYSSGKRIYQEG